MLPDSGSLWSPRHLASAVRAVALTSGRAALRRAIPLYVGLAMAGGLIFGGNGMRAADVTRMAERSPGFRVVFILIWLLCATPGVRALVFARDAFLLRSLPVPRLQFVLALAAHLALLELPLVGLWARGAGAAAALGLLVLCMSAHAVAVAGRFGFPLGLLLAAIPAYLAPPSLAMVGLLPVLAFALARAFRLAPEKPLAAERPQVFGPPLAAIFTTHLVLLRRVHGAVLLRALLYMLVALAIAVLAVRNNAPRSASQAAALALLPLAPGALLVGGTLAGPVLLGERQLRWLLAATGTPGTTRALAASLLGIGMSSLLGLLWAVAVIAILELGLGTWAPRRLLVEGPACAAACAAVASAIVRWAQRGEEADSDRVPGPLAGAIALALLMGWALGELVLLGWALAGPIALARTISLAERTRRAVFGSGRGDRT